MAKLVDPIKTNSKKTVRRNGTYKVYSVVCYTHILVLIHVLSSLTTVTETFYFPILAFVQLSLTVCSLSAFTIDKTFSVRSPCVH